MRKSSRERLKRIRERQRENNNNDEEEYQNLMREAQNGLGQMYQEFRNSIPGLPSFEPSPPPPPRARSPSPPPPPPPPPAGDPVPDITDPRETQARERENGAPKPRFTVNENVPTVGCVSHPYLPIIAPDYSFVMDLMDMRAILINKFYQPRENEPEYNDIVSRVAEVYNRRNSANNNHGYKFILTIMDTTSRKAWMYAQKTKNANETYESFKNFLKDVHGKIARLLSDQDGAFANIRANNDFFTYCQVNAGNNNHKTLSLIDRFTRTFRGILYDWFRNYDPDGRFSWYNPYRGLLDSYNRAKHNALFLRGLPQDIHDDDDIHLVNDQGQRKYRYSPNQVWYNPRLRSRIRLRQYFDGVKNYARGTLYDKIKNAPLVRIRKKVHEYHKGGTHFFTSEIYDKGPKRGNSWRVNGEWVTYRNLLPVGVRESHERRERKKQKKSKWHLEENVRVPERERQANRPQPRRNKGYRVRATSEVGELNRGLQQMERMSRKRNEPAPPQIEPLMADSESEEEEETNNRGRSNFEEGARVYNSGVTRQLGSTRSGLNYGIPAKKRRR